MILLVGACAAYALFVGMASGAGLKRVPLRKVEKSSGVAQKTVNVSSVLKALGVEPGGGIAEELVLANDQDYSYAGIVHVGTPGQDIVVMFDTGSSNFWVKLAGTVGRASSFEPSRSSTYVATGTPFEITYGSGPVSGRFIRDDVRIGELVAKDFLFAEVVNTTGLRGYETWSFDGIFGLGFRRISHGGAPTFMQRLAKTGQLEQPVFGFYLGKDGSDGELVFGGVSPEHVDGDFAFVSLSFAAFWSVPLESIHVGQRLRLTWTPRVIVDSGTSFLAGPDDEVETIARAIRATKINRRYFIWCDRDIPSLTFTIGGKAYVLEKEDLIVRRVGAACLIGMHGTEGLNPHYRMWILGNVFMRKYYVQFDWGRQRLGFALARHPPENFV